jgi:hypothetical protein
MAATAKQVFEAIGEVQTISGYQVFARELDRYTAADHCRQHNPGNITTNASDMVQLSILKQNTVYSAVPQICSQGDHSSITGKTFIANYWAFHSLD